MLYNLFENRDFVSVFAVALLAEGVDRNELQWNVAADEGVALLAEGVDRNLEALCEHTAVVRSPSSRRAWIEMARFCGASVKSWSPSSRRAWIEISKSPLFSSNFASPSSRRAWIEIRRAGACKREGAGSPSSRRAWIEIPTRSFSSSARTSRPPRGGRG